MGARESLVQWDDSYSLGLEQIDDQHKVLFDIMNQLWSAIVRRAEGSEMQRILDELERYTVSHFSAEEAFMLSAGFAGVDEHRRQHAGFVERIRSARSDLRQGKEVSLELLHFLRDWLVRTSRPKTAPTRPTTARAARSAACWGASSRSSGAPSRASAPRPAAVLAGSAVVR